MFCVVCLVEWDYAATSSKRLCTLEALSEVLFLRTNTRVHTENGAWVGGGKL